MQLLSPQKVYGGTEWYIRAGYKLTRMIIQELVDGNEFHLIPKVDPETGMVNKIEHRAESKSGRRSGTIINSTQIVIEIIDALGLETTTERPVTQELVLKPNFPIPLNKPVLKELPPANRL